MVRHLALVAALAAASPAAAQAQAGFPDHPLRLIVGFPPGGPNDLMARLVAPRMSELLKQPIVVENRGGSNGEIAAAAVAKAPADGYTLLFISNGTMAINPALGKKTPYDPQKDLAGVSLVAESPMLLVVHPGVAAQSLAELIALGRAQPGKLNVASAGNGSPTHLAAELFKALAKVDAVHVPYKGGGPALTDLMAGQVQMYFGGFTTAIPYAKAGKLRAIAVTGRTRTGAAPDIPTMAEAGVPGYAASIWYALLTTGGTPAPVVARLHDALTRVTRTPEIRAKLVELGADPLESTPAQFATFLAEDIDRWTKVVRSAGIKPE